MSCVGLVQQRSSVSWASASRTDPSSPTPWPQLCDPDSVTPTPWPRLRGPDSVTPTLWPPLRGGVPSFAATKVPLFESTGRVAREKLVFFTLASPRDLSAHLSFPCVVFLSRAFVISGLNSGFSSRRPFLSSANSLLFIENCLVKFLSLLWQHVPGKCSFALVFPSVCLPASASVAGSQPLQRTLSWAPHPLLSRPL